VPARLPDRHLGRWKVRIRERPHGNGDELRLCLRLIEDRRAALGAEGERRCSTRVGDTYVFAVRPFGSYLLRGEPRLKAKGAPRPPLAGKAMTDRDANRLALRRQTKLPAATSGVPGHCALATRALNTESTQRAFERGYTCSDAVEVLTGERQEPHRRARDHSGRPLSRQEEPDFAKRVAGPESLGRLATVSQDIGLSLFDEVDRCSVVVIRDDLGTRFDLCLAHRGRELVELGRRKISENRKCGDPTRIHDRGSCHKKATWRLRPEREVDLIRRLRKLLAFARRDPGVTLVEIDRWTLPEELWSFGEDALYSMPLQMSDEDMIRVWPGSCP
jgi:hypothetical protein